MPALAEEQDVDHDIGAGIGPETAFGKADGGNEIGIGAIAPIVAQTPGLPDRPCINWGAYGMLAALSKLTRRMLLVEPEEEAEAWSWLDARPVSERSLSE